MAYIPPRLRRHSQAANPTPAPTFPFQPTPAPTPSPAPAPYPKKKKKIRPRWLVIPSNDSDDQDGELSCSVRLKELIVESIEFDDGNEYMILVHEDDHPKKEMNENVNRIVKPPWVSITEKIQQDLLTSFQTAREEMCKDGPELNLPRFVIRLGKFLFYGIPYESRDKANKSSAIENILSPVKKRYNTDVPKSLCESIRNTGLDILEDKEYYYVKVLDKLRADATISCKCSVTRAAGELHLRKIELSEIRKMVVDISCLEKNLDLRLLLSSKRILVLTDDEKHCLNSLVNSAEMDSNVKGGLRWPFGMKSFCDRYKVAGAWHTISRVYKCSFLRLKIRKADRINYETSKGDVSREVSLWNP